MKEMKVRRPRTRNLFHERLQDRRVLTAASGMLLGLSPTQQDASESPWERGAAEGESLDKVARIRLAVVDEHGQQISQLQVGGAAAIRVFAKDLRVNPDGVFAAYVQVGYNQDTLAVFGEPSFGEEFANVRSYELNPGEIDRLGAAGGIAPLGGEEFLLAEIPIRGRSSGLASLAIDLETDAELAVLLYGSDDIVDADDVLIENGALTFRVVAWHNAANPLDVNDDGTIDVRDAHALINYINSHGAGQLPNDMAGPPFADVSHDGILSPLDPLRVINYLNAFMAYSFQVEDGPGEDGKQETRLYRGDHHFGTLIADPEGGVIFRPHPGTDPNGWGSSVYLSPFVAVQEEQPESAPGAVHPEGEITAVEETPDGIFVEVSGAIVRSLGEAFGTYMLGVKFRYDSKEEVVTTSGGLVQLELPGPLSEVDGDLNLYRVTSNYLVNVPLQGTELEDNTGDMRFVDVSYGPQSSVPDFRWVPSQGNHFPTDTSQILEVTVEGERNAVDTLALGQEAQIAVADKPTIAMTHVGRTGETLLSWGGWFDAEKMQDPYADNVGSIVIVRGTSPTTSIAFDFELWSTPPRL